MEEDSAVVKLVHPIAAKHIDILQMSHSEFKKMEVTEIGEENEADVADDAGTGGESDRKRRAKQNPQAMRSRHKASIFQVDGPTNSSNELSWSQQKNTLNQPRIFMLPNVTNKAEMSTRNDRLISEMMRGGAKVELAKT